MGNNGGDSDSDTIAALRARAIARLVIYGAIKRQLESIAVLRPYVPEPMIEALVSECEHIAQALDNLRNADS